MAVPGDAALFGLDGGPSDGSPSVDLPCHTGSPPRRVATADQDHDIQLAFAVGLALTGAVLTAVAQVNGLLGPFAIHAASAPGNIASMTSNNKSCRLSRSGTAASPCRPSQLRDCRPQLLKPLICHGECPSLLDRRRRGAGKRRLNDEIFLEEAERNLVAQRKALPLRDRQSPGSWIPPGSGAVGGTR